MGLGTASTINPLALSLWPNPAKDKLQFRFSPISDKGSYRVEVRDVLGKRCLQLELGQAPVTQQEVSLETLEPGLYFLNLSKGQTQSSLRFVKE